MPRLFLDNLPIRLFWADFEFSDGASSYKTACGVQESHRTPLRTVLGGEVPDDFGRLGFRAGVVGSLLYSLACAPLDVMATSYGDQAKRCS